MNIHKYEIFPFDGVKKNVKRKKKLRTRIASWNTNKNSHGGGRGGLDFLASFFCIHLSHLIPASVNLNIFMHGGVSTRVSFKIHSPSACDAAVPSSPFFGGAVFWVECERSSYLRG